jgi:hypothetical protein
LGVVFVVPNAGGIYDPAKIANFTSPEAGETARKSRGNTPQIRSGVIFAIGFPLTPSSKSQAGAKSQPKPPNPEPALPLTPFLEPKPWKTVPLFL